MTRLYRIQQASELAGVSAGLIRAWERRHGLVKPRRTASGYRAYSEADVELLRRMRQLTEEGVSISEAARLAPAIRRELSGPNEPPAFPVEATQVERWRDALLSATHAYDQASLDAMLDEAMAVLSPVAVFDQVIAPTLVEIGEQWHRGALSVAQEHLATNAIRIRLSALLKGGSTRGGRHVVCACFPGDEHELGLLGAALRMREAGFRVTYLGSGLSVEELKITVDTLRPRFVALSAVAQGSKTLRTTLSAIVAALGSKTRIVIGGSAATALRTQATALGVVIVASAEDWAAVLG